MKKNKPVSAELPFNSLPFLPPEKAMIETLPVLRQLVNSSVVLAELKGLTSTLPNPQILLNAVILKEARASSEIENVITTQDKLYEALSAKAAQSDAATKEVLRYREAMLKGFSILQKKGFINTNAIIEIQKTLEHNNAGIRKLPGTALKHAATGKVIYTPPDDHSTILQLLKNYEDYLNNAAEIPPLITLAVQHFQFESIHPFYDGNGRTGRIINILHLVLHGLLESPLLYLSAYIIENKTDYYRLLQEVRTKNNWEGWILYMLKGIEQTAAKTIGQIKDINQLFAKTQDKIKKGLQKTYSKELLEILFEHPYCKTEYITQRLGISRITATKYLKELESLGILQSKKIWKETLYINTGLYNLLKK